MRIALTYNLRLSDSEEEAEFDTQETVNALASAIERLGHRLERFEVSGPASRTVARLEAYSPDLIFNTAEGRRGRFREAFYPALFDELGFPYTGSDAYALAVTLDKQLTKLILRDHDVQTPGWQYIETIGELRPTALRFPLIVKPNFEGSSKGITQDSVAETVAELEEKVARALERYPAGILVEEYIAGRDLTVPFLAAVENEFGGVLSPVEYVIDPKVSRKRRYAIYDYALKTTEEKAVQVKAPAKIPPAMADELRRVAQNVLRLTDCRDLGRIDFRLSDAGVPYFLEINALPSLEPGAGIYAAAELEGLHFDAVIGSVIQAAARRYGIKDSPRRQGKPTRKSGPLRVGFAYNVKRIKPSADAVEDSEAEYDSPSTLQAIREAIASWGHEVIDLEANQELPNVLAVTPLDLVFNIAEGFMGRNRESQVPALLALLVTADRATKDFSDERPVIHPRPLGDEHQVAPAGGQAGQRVALQEEEPAPGIHPEVDPRHVATPEGHERPAGGGAELLHLVRLQLRRDVVADAIVPVELVLEAVDRVHLPGVGEDDLHRRKHPRPPLAEQADGELPAGDVFLDQGRLLVLAHQLPHHLAQLGLVAHHALAHHALARALGDGLHHQGVLGELPVQPLLAGGEDLEVGSVDPVLADDALGDRLVEGD